METVVILIAVVARMLGVSISTIGRWTDEARKGKRQFPLPISERGGKRRWLLSDIELHIASLSTTRTPVPKTSQQRRRNAKARQSREEQVDKVLERYRTKGNRNEK